jgi:hypothetical protein
MIILWVRKNKADKHNSAANRESQSFQEHDDIMKKFRLAHPDIAINNAKSMLTAEGNSLLPMQPVKLWANIQN